jgi:hypothetical protein
MEMFDLRGDCRPGDSGESEIDESGSGDKPPKGKEVSEGDRITGNSRLKKEGGEREEGSNKWIRRNGREWKHMGS